MNLEVSLSPGVPQGKTQDDIEGNKSSFKRKKEELKNRKGLWGRVYGFKGEQKKSRSLHTKKKL